MTAAAAIVPVAAMLDPASGRIIGYALGDGRSPADVQVRLDGKVVARQLAVLPIGDLGVPAFQTLGPPPTAICGFALRLPSDAAGSRLSVAVRRQRDGGFETVLEEEVGGALSLARYREGAIMSDMVTISQIRLRSGRLLARVDSPGAPEAPKIALHLRGEVLGEARLRPADEHQWDMDVALPGDMLGDGVLVLELVLGDGSVAASYVIAAGAALAGDMASEVASLRAELDRLKRSFRDAMSAGVLTRDERPMIVADALTQMDHLLEMRDRRDLAVSREAPVTDWDDDAAPWEVDD
ncbi:MAG: hypothetical protein AAF367_12290 [Pseudomonadota bacterium]